MWMQLIQVLKIHNSVVYFVSFQFLFSVFSVASVGPHAVRYLDCDIIFNVCVLLSKTGKLKSKLKVLTFVLKTSRFLLLLCAQS